MDQQKMNQLSEDLMKETTDAFKVMEETEEYKNLVIRQKELIKKCATLTDEIFDNRNDDEKIAKLLSVKSIMDDSLNDVSGKIMDWKENLSETLKIKFSMKLKLQEYGS